jgi:hypothetical protein
MLPAKLDLTCHVSHIVGSTGQGTVQSGHSDTSTLLYSLTSWQAIAAINHLAGELDIHAAMDSVRNTVLELLGCEKVGDDHSMIVLRLLAARPTAVTLVCGIGVHRLSILAACLAISIFPLPRLLRRWPDVARGVGGGCFKGKVGRRICSRRPDFRSSPA